MGQAEILKVVVASPSDVQAERDIVPRVVEEVQHGDWGRNAARLLVSVAPVNSYVSPTDFLSAS